MNPDTNRFERKNMADKEIEYTEEDEEKEYTEELEKDNKRLTEELGALKLAGETLADVLNCELKKAHDHIKTLSDELEVSKAAHKDVSENNVELDKSITNMAEVGRGQLESRDKTIEELEEENKKLEATLENTQAGYEAVSSILEGVKNENAQISKNNEGLRELNEGLKISLDEFQNSEGFGELKDENLELRIEIVDLKKKIAELEAIKTSEVVEQQKTRIAELEYDIQTANRRLKTKRGSTRPAGMR